MRAQGKACVMMDLTLGDNCQAANEPLLMAGGKDRAELSFLPSELKINIILHLYYRHLAVSFKLLVN